MDNTPLIYNFYMETLKEGNREKTATDIYKNCPFLSVHGHLFVLQSVLENLHH